MKRRTLFFSALLLNITAPLMAQPGAPGFPGGGSVAGSGAPGQLPQVEDMAFPGKPQYGQRLLEAEKAYKAAIAKARAAYVQDIKKFQMRASMMPAASQKLDAEVKRIETLPEAVVIPEPKVAE